MRIAVSGSHRTGKSTLVADLADLLPGYAAVPEPYELLEEEGCDFPEVPSLEDFEVQLERSIELLRDARADSVFERCPVDFLAYALCSRDSDAFDPADWIERIRPAMAALDFAVFVPVEDRIAVPVSEDREYRLAVDEKLREILVDDPFDLGVEALEVSGDRSRRVAMVLLRIRKGRGRNGMTIHPVQLLAI